MVLILKALLPFLLLIVKIIVFKILLSKGIDNDLWISYS